MRRHFVWKLCIALGACLAGAVGLWMWASVTGVVDRNAIRAALADRGDRLFAGGYRIIDRLDDDLAGSTFPLDLERATFRLPGEPATWEVVPGALCKVQRDGTMLVLGTTAELDTTPARDDDDCLTALAAAQLPSLANRLDELNAEDLARVRRAVELRWELGYSKKGATIVDGDAAVVVAWNGDDTDVESFVTVWSKTTNRFMSMRILSESFEARLQLIEIIGCSISLD